MAQSDSTCLIIDLNHFKLHLNLPGQKPLSLHFDTPSRRFYISVMALVLEEMKKAGKVSFVPLEKHAEILSLLNETVGGSGGSSEKKNLLPRIYRKWKDALPDLEGAPLFRVPGRKKEYSDGSAKTYAFDDITKDAWANLFAYWGSGENTQLRLSIDRLGIPLEDVTLVYGPEPEDEGDAPAWDRFLEGLRKKQMPDAKPSNGKDSGGENLLSDDGKAHEERNSKRPRWINPVWTAVLILALLGSLFAGIRSMMNKPAASTGSDSPQSSPAPLIDKPSIAVLPFTNMTGDSDQDYIADGISENIISALSKIGEIFVIARNSTFTYKNQAVNVQQVANNLGVRYVLEGSVMKSGDTIRVSAQLIDAQSGHHLWAEKFDRKMADFFGLLDEITREIGVALQVKLTHGAQARKWYATSDFEAWGKVAKGLSLFESYSKANNEKARELFEEAVALDPECAFAWTMLGWTHYIDVRFAFDLRNPAESFKKAFQYAQKAQSIDNNSSDGHALLGSIYMIRGEFDQAISGGQKAVDLDPNNALSHILFSQILLYAGNPDRSVEMAEQAMRLCPKCPAWYEAILGRSYVDAGRHEDAIRVFSQVLKRAEKGEFPLYLAHSQLAVNYSMTGQHEKARHHLNETLRNNPGFSLEQMRKINFYKDPQNLEAIFEALRKAGLPESPSSAERAPHS